MTTPRGDPDHAIRLPHGFATAPIPSAQSHDTVLNRLIPQPSIIRMQDLAAPSRRSPSHLGSTPTMMPQASMSPYARSYPWGGPADIASLQYSAPMVHMAHTAAAMMASHQAMAAVAAAAAHHQCGSSSGSSHHHGGTPSVMVGGLPVAGGSTTSIYGTPLRGGGYPTAALSSAHLPSVGSPALASSTPGRGGRTVAHAALSQLPHDVVASQAASPDESPVVLGTQTVGMDKRVAIRRLERDLAEATKEELLQLVLEMTYYSPEAANFVECKSQIFSLRPRLRAAEPYDAADGNQGTPSATADATAKRDRTPAKDNAKSMVLDDCRPEHRAFCTERHPCVKVYGACRFSSCVFAGCPQNLCLSWVRGACSYGSECMLVHRIPEDASDSIKQLVSVQTDRHASTTLLPLHQGATPARLSRPQN